MGIFAAHFTRFVTLLIYYRVVFTWCDFMYPVHNLFYQLLMVCSLFKSMSAGYPFILYCANYMTNVKIYMVLKCRACALCRSTISRFGLFTPFTSFSWFCHHYALNYFNTYLIISFPQEYRHSIKIQIRNQTIKSKFFQPLFSIENTRCSSVCLFFLISKHKLTVHDLSC